MLWGYPKYFSAPAGRFANLRRDTPRVLRCAHPVGRPRIVLRTLRTPFRLRPPLRAFTPTRSGLHFFAAARNAFWAPLRVVIFVVRIAVRIHFLYFAFDPRVGLQTYARPWTFTTFFDAVFLRPPFLLTMPVHSLKLPARCLTAAFWTLELSVFALALWGLTPASSLASTGCGLLSLHCKLFVAFLWCLAESSASLLCSLELGASHRWDNTLFESRLCASYAAGSFASWSPLNHMCMSWWRSFDTTPSYLMAFTCHYCFTEQSIRILYIKRCFKKVLNFIAIRVCTFLKHAKSLFVLSLG